AGWALFFWPAHPVVAAMGAMAILLGYAWVLALELVLLAVFAGADHAPRPGWGALLRAWWGEVLAFPRVFFWRQAFRADAVSDFLPARAPGTAAVRGVVFVHGLFCNRGFWTPWMRQLLARGRPFMAVNLSPPWGDIDAQAQGIEVAVQRITDATGLAPVLVCHSMGGLVVRSWLRGALAGDRIHRVVTIATPHAGTWMARLSGSVHGIQMRRGSAWLAKLHGDAAAAPDYSRFVCWYSNTDNMVFPAPTATLPGADNRCVPGVAHVALAFEPRVMRETLALV
ncbi:MAG: permease, partial [Rhodoferax sp.]|nr:permease [Rhodoferax sp.]